MAFTYSQAEIDSNIEKYKEILEEIQKISGTMAGGVQHSITDTTFNSLLDDPVEFGNPLDELVRIQAEDFERLNLQLNPIAKRQLNCDSESAHDCYDFYFISMTLLLKAPNGMQYSEIAIELSFGPKGSNEPIIQSQFPISEWNSVLKFGGTFKLGLDADLNWKVGLTSPDNITDVGNLETQVTNANSMSACILVPKFVFDSGRMEIASTGIGGSNAFWYVEKTKLQASFSPKFGLVFKVPKHVTNITLEGKVKAEPYFPWLVSDLGHVWDNLSERIRSWFKSEKTLPIGKHEIWQSIRLP